MTGAAARTVAGLYGAALAAAFTFGEVAGRLLARWDHRQAPTIPADRQAGPSVFLDTCAPCGAQRVPVTAITVNPRIASGLRTIVYRCPGCGWDVHPPVGNLFGNDLVALGAAERTAWAPLTRTRATLTGGIRAATRPALEDRQPPACTSRAPRMGTRQPDPATHAPPAPPDLEGPPDEHRDHPTVPGAASTGSGGPAAAAPPRAHRGVHAMPVGLPLRDRPRYPAPGRGAPQGRPPRRPAGHR